MARTVFFHVLGEPLLHRDVFDAIELANSLNLSVSLYTNGALLDEQRSSKLLEVLREGRVVLSMQDVSSEAFGRRCRRKLSWEKYIEQMQEFIQLAETSESPIPVQVHCMIDIADMGCNLRRIFCEQKRIQAVYDQWKKALGIEKRTKINVFNPAISYPLGRYSSFFVKHTGNWDNQLIGDEFEIVQRDSGHCALMTDTFAILSDGTCTYCCDDFEGKLDLSNAKEKSLEDIYYGNKASRIRKAEKNGRFIENHCKICRGSLVYKKNRKLASSRNILTDFYVLKEHLDRYGLTSSVRKLLESLQRRLRRR